MKSERTRVTEEERRKMVELYRRGYSLSEIGKEINRHYVVVNTHLIQMGVKKSNAQEAFEEKMSMAIHKDILERENFGFKVGDRVVCTVMNDDGSEKRKEKVRGTIKLITKRLYSIDTTKGYSYTVMKTDLFCRFVHMEKEK